MSSGAGNGFTAKEHQKWYAAPPAVPFLTFFTRTTFPCPTGRTIFNGQQETDASAHKGTLLRKVFQSDKGWRKEKRRKVPGGWELKGIFLLIFHTFEKEAEGVGRHGRLRTPTIILSFSS